MSSAKPLVIERKGGWPGAAGRLMLVFAALALGWGLLQAPPSGRGQVDLRAYWLEVSVLLAGSGALLLAWRRGTIIESDLATASPWWGVGGFGLRMVVRRGASRSLRGYSGVRVVQTNPAHHYKRFHRPMYHVQLEVSESEGGQLTLRERLIVDDEIADAQDARRSAQRVADHLGLARIDHL